MSDLSWLPPLFQVLSDQNLTEDSTQMAREDRNLPQQTIKARAIS